jgi:hypothetical protein
LSANSLFGARPLLGPLLQASVSDPQRMPERLLLRYLAPFVGPGGAADLLRLASAVAVNADSEMTLASWRGETLLWCGGRAAPADGEAPTTRIARWQAALPHAMVRPIITHQPPGMLVAEDAPAALASALHDWIT